MTVKRTVSVRGGFVSVGLIWELSSANRDLVDEAKDYHLMPERRPHLPAFKTRQRCCTSIAGLIYAVGGLNSAGIVITDGLSSELRTLKPFLISR